ncbi:hypothetical protein K469DRAFT_526233, partial [Zopfia rhizophila CBS 207.26]
PRISEGEIKDKEKVDFLVNLLVLAQFLWLATLMIARKIAHLPCAQLEMAILGFACSVLTYIAACNKANDVETPFIF